MSSSMSFGGGLEGGESGGLLCGDRLAWLEQQLAAAPATPTLVAMHHPPFTTGIGHMDDIGQCLHDEHG